ncbi:hypothetical protein OHS59_16290 [Streptomyces sp. NBC_00414]|uniref:hypothetical protein n=1 Tax=Streptomyces sp. NBC_00414 TaxID=2975739 RepID=UPI002E1B38DE
MMVPKAFRIEDYKARAVHDYATRARKSDGELLRDIVSRYLEDQGYDPYDYIEPTTGSTRSSNH